MTSPQSVFIAQNAARRLALVASSLDGLAPEISVLAEMAGTVLARGNKVLVFGNGGSAACAQHFAAEFTGKLSLQRRPLPAVALSTDTSAITAIANDMGYDEVFSRQLQALGSPGDLAIGLSTSGTSRNVIRALDTAQELGLVTVLLAGQSSPMDFDFKILVPLSETARIQEAHDCILHTIASIAERSAVADMNDDKSTDRYPFLLDEVQIEDFNGWLDGSDQRLVTTNGVFDLLHKGHRASLKAASRFGDRLVVLVNTDQSVRNLNKGPNRPIRPLADRLDDLRSVPEVSHVIAMSDSDPIRLLSLLQPSVHCKGAEYRDLGVLEEEVVVAHGGRMEYIDLLSGYSTTSQEIRITGTEPRS